MILARSLREALMDEAGWGNAARSALRYQHHAPARMRAGIATACLLMLQALSPAIAGGRVETGLDASSRMLGHPVRYAIYLPEAPAAAAGRRLPVLYLLHGRGDSESAWLEHGNIAAILDRKIVSGELQPLIVVMPMAGNSWYVDDARSGAGSYGAMAQALTGDLMAAVDSRYRTAACREARGVGGLSMGGFGAMVYAFDHPELYSAAFSLSGSLFSEQADDIAARRGRYAQMFGGVYGEPFDEARFRSWTAFAKLDKAGPEAKKVAVWLAAGDDDFPALLSGTVRFHQELQRRSVSSELRIYDGAHTWALWSSAVDPALSWLSARLDPGCGATARKPIQKSEQESRSTAAPVQPVVRPTPASGVDKR